MPRSDHAADIPDDVPAPLDADTPPRAARTAAVAQYYATYPRTHPGHAVATVAGAAIRESALRHFSGRLLDIGCGAKTKALLVGDCVDAYIGLDHAHSPHDTGHVDVFGSAYAVPVRDASFDCVLCTAVIEHLERPLAALREACRVLKPGGIALYTAPLFWHLHEEPRDFFRYTRHGLGYLFDAAGFEVLELRALGGFCMTFGTELNYYVQRFRRGVRAHLIDAWVGLTNRLLPRLDRGILRDEAFTWMYLVLARRPSASGGSASTGPAQ